MTQKTIKKKTRILLVEKKSAQRNNVTRFLKQSGFETALAGSGKTAIRRLRKNRVDIVIADLHLPGATGLALTRKIQSKFSADVIALTTHGDGFRFEETILQRVAGVVFKPVRPEELLFRIRRVINKRRLEKERKRTLKNLKKLVITDDLTKLYNYRHFYHQLVVEIQRSFRYHSPLSLLMLDIDHFKHYNDKYGHVEGDVVLRRLGEKIQGGLRAIDSAYRYGGEEFAVILPETSGKEAVLVAERIRNIVFKEQFNPGDGEKIQITISAGASQYHPDESAKDLIRRADHALYLSKKKGRDRATLLASS